MAVPTFGVWLGCQSTGCGPTVVVVWLRIPVSFMSLCFFFPFWELFRLQNCLFVLYYVSSIHGCTYSINTYTINHMFDHIVSLGKLLQCGGLFCTAKTARSRFPTSRAPQCVQLHVDVVQNGR